MAKAFLGTDIGAILHINSKIHVWKRDYGTIALMLVGRTGVGWNDSTKMIHTNDDIWDAVMKVDKNASLVRYKSWPYYHDWCEIFGKDRAIGEQAEDVIIAVNKILNTTTNKEKEVTVDINVLLDDFEDNSTYQSVNTLIKRVAEKKESRHMEMKDVSATRKDVFDIVGKIGGLTLQEKLLVSKILVKNTEELELFSSLPEDAHAEFVRMMLEGKL